MPSTIPSVVEQLSQRRADAVTTLELLRGFRERVETEKALLENPVAVLEYLDYFIPAIEEVVEVCDQISTEVQQQVKRSHLDLLRQIAANCRVEQRRCLGFRDKCINRPLPHESMRPLLNDISVTTRDQLTAFFDLNNAAARLEPFVPAEPEPDPKRTLGRRELFNRLFKVPKE